MTQPKILLYDIETNGVNALYADLGFAQCIGYKWLHEKKTHVLSLTPEEITRHKGERDGRILKAFLPIVEEADVLVAHYGAIFDKRFIKGRLLKNGLGPIPNIRHIDTCLSARAHFKFRSNRLGNLAKFLNLDEKKQEKGNGWPDWWHQSMHGHQPAMTAMAKYCAQDIKTLEKVYLALEPYIGGVLKPNVQRPDSPCPLCGGHHVHRRGYETLKSGKYIRYQCRSCAAWFKGEKVK